MSLALKANTFRIVTQVVAIKIIQGHQFWYQLTAHTDKMAISNSTP